MGGCATKPKVLNPAAEPPVRSKEKEVVDDVAVVAGEQEVEDNRANKERRSLSHLFKENEEKGKDLTESDKKITHKGMEKGKAIDEVIKENNDNNIVVSTAEVEEILLVDEERVVSEEVNNEDSSQKVDENVKATAEPERKTNGIAKENKYENETENKVFDENKAKSDVEKP